MLLRQKPLRHYRQWFLNGQYDRLFGLYQDDERTLDLVRRFDERMARKAALKKNVRLQGGTAKRPLWVELVPESTRQATVELSNFLAKGTVVRSRIPWSQAVRPRAVGSERTFVDPGWLKVIRLPMAVPARRRVAA